MMENNSTTSNRFREEESSINILELWNLIWGHKWWYLLSTMVFLFIGTFYIYRTPDVYNRSAKVMIDESNQDATMRNLGVASAGMMRLRSFNSVENEMEAFSSPDLMKVVVERLGLETRYVEQQFMREVELYKNSPIAMVLAGENPTSGFSFEVINGGDDHISLTNFRFRDENIKEVVNGCLGDTLITPVGSIVIYPIDTEHEFKHPIRISWSNSMSMAKRYCQKLNLTLSGKESSVIILSMSDTYPSRCSSVISTLIDVYNEVWIGDKNRAAINTAEFINERLVVIERELGTVEESLKQYKSTNNLTDIKAAAKTYIDESSRYATKLFEATNQLSIAQYIKSYLNDPVNSMTLIPSNLGLTSASVESQIVEYNNLVLQRDRLLTGSGTSNPLIADLNATLTSIKSAILRSVENLIATLELQIAKIESQEKQILSRMSSSSGQELQLLSIERKQQITQNLYMFLLEKREENELAALINVGNTRVLMNPNGSSNPVAPNKLMIVFAMLVLGLGLPFAFFFLVKMFDTRVKNKGDLGNVAIPFLAEIPQYVSKTKDIENRVILVEQGKRDMMNEAFRVLRTNVDLLLGRQKGTKVIMFTSLNPASGKTFNSMNTAATMALKGAKTLLVDLDLRKATLSKSIGLKHSGVAAYLNGKNDGYEESIDKIADNLYVLPVGTLPPNPSELLLSDRFSEMLEKMKEQYDYIFLDCPPIDIVADSNIITSYVDLTIMVLRVNLFKKEMLPYVEDMYRSGKFNHLALILNGVEMTFNKYGYGNGFGYGYGYGNTGDED